MKKTLLASFVIVALAVTTVSSTAHAVSLADLQAQINNLLQRVSLLQSQLTTKTSATYLPQVTLPITPHIQERCLRIADDLYYGMHDRHVNGAVSDLQKFLAESSFLNNSFITGFFGPRTIQAVKDFQARQGIVTFGDPETTGFGRVGPSTRRAMQKFCTSVPNNNAQLTVVKSDNTDGKVFVFTSTHGDISSYQPSHADGQDTMLDFGDGSPHQWVQCQSSDTPSYSIHRCANPVSYKHEYKASGTYTARLVRSGGYCPAPGCPVTELASVKVNVPSTTFCTKEYAPVCGQPQGCSACPDGAYCTMICNLPEPQTYSNSCVLKNTNARFLYNGICDAKPTPTNTAPVIESFEGPTTLYVGKRGVWTITAHDKERGSLRYSIDWGDEPVYKYLTSDAAAPFNEYGQQTTFEHAYNNVGVYTVRATVTDGHGLQTSSTITVNVTKDIIDPITNQCKSWYDGCNTCSRSSQGGPALCTLRACYQQEPAYCKAYFNTTSSTCILEGDMAYAEGQSVQCIRDNNGYQTCIADASYVCRSGQWKIEGGLPVNTLLNYNDYNINEVIQNLNTGDQDFSQILNDAAGILNSLFSR